MNEQKALDVLNLYAKPRHIEKLSDCWFYHHINLPGIGEVGEHWDLRETVDHYLGHLDFSGKRALDVGAAGGFLTFSMEARGAAVVSFDLADPAQLNLIPYGNGRFPLERKWQEGKEITARILNAYWFAHRVLNSKARVCYGNVYDLPEALGMFDVVVLGMILPHLRDPFLALSSAARRCADTLVITQQSPQVDQPYALFLPSITKDPESLESYFAWWVLTEKCLSNMLEVLGFRVISSYRRMYKITASTRPEKKEECLTLVARKCSAPGPGFCRRIVPPCTARRHFPLLRRLKRRCMGLFSK